MHKNSTLLKYSNNSQKNTCRTQERNAPSAEIIQELLAYSKALTVIKTSSEGKQGRKLFRLILN